MHVLDLALLLGGKAVQNVGSVLIVEERWISCLDDARFCSRFRSLGDGELCCWVFSDTLG